MRYFIRVRDKIGDRKYSEWLQWLEIPGAVYDALRDGLGVKAQNFLKGRIEGQVIGSTSYEIYKALYPDLYAILTEES